MIKHLIALFILLKFYSCQVKNDDNSSLNLLNDENDLRLNSSDSVNISFDYDTLLVEGNKYYIEYENTTAKKTNSFNIKLIEENYLNSKKTIYSYSVQDYNLDVSSFEIFNLNQDRFIELVLYDVAVGSSWYVFFNPKEQKTYVTSLLYYDGEEIFETKEINTKNCYVNFYADSAIQVKLFQYNLDKLN